MVNEFSHKENGSEVLEYYKFDSWPKGTLIWIVALFILFFALLAYRTMRVSDSTLVHVSPNLDTNAASIILENGPNNSDLTRAISINNNKIIDGGIQHSVKLVFSSINFSIDTSDGAKKILNDVSGIANPGEVLALMGSSGSG